MRTVLAAALVTAALAAVVCSVEPAPDHDPPPSCELPARTCVGSAAYCGELVQIAMLGPGYVDIRLSGEQTAETSTSYLRRDLMLLVRYAAAKVACQADAWSGNGGLIALSDMSERDGSTPGTRTGAPRHPAGTHVGGRDIDIAYYQRDTLDNQLRPICAHHDAAGANQHRCLAPPTRLDARRTALFFGALLEEPRIRAIGIDGMAAAPILSAFDALCANRWIERSACALRDRIRFERTNTGAGWYRGHHHHFHVSLHAISVSHDH